MVPSSRMQSAVAARQEAQRLAMKEEEDAAVRNVRGMNSWTKKILALMFAGPDDGRGSMSPMDIGVRLCRERKNASTWACLRLGNLMDRGYVERLARGQYALTENGRWVAVVAMDLGCEEAGDVVAK
jgi:hypothetical protein